MQGQSGETTTNENNTYQKQGDKSPIQRRIVFYYCLRITEEPNTSKNKNDPFCTTKNNLFFKFFIQNGGHYLAPWFFFQKHRGPQNGGHYVAPSFCGVVRPHIPSWPARLGHAAPRMSDNHPSHFFWCEPLSCCKRPFSQASTLSKTLQPICHLVTPRPWQTCVITEFRFKGNQKP